jgi:hypothetical protein
MTKTALGLWLALASFPAVDSDLQPACRQQCEEIYAQELAACERSERADVCQDEANDRHQECIDRCND